MKTSVEEQVWILAASEMKADFDRRIEEHRQALVGLSPDKIIDWALEMRGLVDFTDALKLYLNVHKNILTELRAKEEKERRRIDALEAKRKRAQDAQGHSSKL